MFQISQLSEITTLITKGTTPSMVGRAFTESGVNFIKAESVTLDGHVNETVFAYIDEETHDKLKRSQLESGDILFSIAGMKLGKSAVVRDRHVPANTNQALAIVRADRTRAIPEYLHYHFLNPDFYRYVNSITAQAAQPNINLGQVGSLPISLPPLSVQQRIAHILCAYDELIENYNQQIKVLESMARRIYREWFVHFRFPGHQSVLFDNSSPGDAPEGWAIKKLGDLCQLTKEKYRDTEHSELPLLDMARMPSRCLAPGNTGSPSEMKTSRITFQRGDTLFGSIRCYLHKVVAVNFSGVTNTSVLVLRPKSPSFRALLTMIASDNTTIRWAETQSTGLKMPVIKWNVFQEMATPIPSKELAQAFEKVAGPMIDEIGVLSTQIQCLRLTRNLILPRLLSGRINLR